MIWKKYIMAVRVDLGTMGNTAMMTTVTMVTQSPW